MRILSVEARARTYNQSENPFDMEDYVRVLEYAASLNQTPGYTLHVIVEETPEGWVDNATNYYWAFQDYQEMRESQLFDYVSKETILKAV